LAAADPAPAVTAMAEAGILELVLPCADASTLTGLVGVEATAGAVPRWQRRLAALGPCSDTAGRLRLSRADAKTLELTARALAAAATPAAAGYRFGAAAAHDAALIRAAREGRPLLAGIEAEIARGAAAKLPVTAADLPQAGPALGAELRRLEALWIASDLRMDRAQLQAAALR